MRLTRRYRFSASHRLHSARLSDEANRRRYGKCDNRFGHGHNYLLEVSVAGSVEPASGQLVKVAQLDRLVREQVVAPFQLKNLNRQVDAFARLVPTAENIATEIRRRLLEHWPNTFPVPGPRLERIRLYETRKNIVELVEEKS